MRNLNTNTTIELVGHGHPDRFADYIGELVLTKNLEQDKNAKVALEVLATGKSISLGGEITSNADIDYKELVHSAIEKVYGEQ
jgi:S-adenosylmethionine synthetase